MYGNWPTFSAAWVKGYSVRQRYACAAAFLLVFLLSVLLTGRELHRRSKNAQERIEQSDCTSPLTTQTRQYWRDQ